MIRLGVGILIGMAICNPDKAKDVLLSTIDIIHNLFTSLMNLV